MYAAAGADGGGCKKDEQQQGKSQAKSPSQTMLTLTLTTHSYSPPDIDVFSTPPTTPMTSEPLSESVIRPSLSRTGSRPSSLHLSHTTADFKPDILLDLQTPQVLPSTKNSPQSASSQPVSSVNGHTPANSDTSQHLPTTTGHSTTNRTLVPSPDSSAVLMPRSQSHSQSPTISPCFVHSNLDKGASFSEWLNTGNGFPRINISPALQPTTTNKAPSRRYRKLDNGQVLLIPYEDEELEHVFDASDYEDDEGSGSLTKQLAETAVGVREMSKQLGTFLLGRSLPPYFRSTDPLTSGRARIKSNIQNILIVTKARDNRLIALTRALALYLMKKPRLNGRGLVVYVMPTLSTHYIYGMLTCS